MPSMQPHRNSFLLGVACTLLTVGLWTLVMPVLKQWLQTLLASGGVGVFVLVIGVGVAAWAWGKTQGESSSRGPGGAGAGASAEGASHRANGYAPPPKPQQQPGWQAPPPPPPPPPQPEAPKADPPKHQSDAASGWEKAREETRKREEERKRAEELRKKREEASRLREEAERAARAKAEKEKWEQARAREREQREREARERIARERLAREKEQREKDVREREAREKDAREKDTREREARERLARAAQARAASASAPTSPAKSATSRPAASKYEKPAATSYMGSEAGGAHSFRPYDTPAARTPAYKSSASSVSGLSESSYAPSQSTARTTPPPSARGPYSTKDPDKIQIKAVYLFSDSFPNKPLAQLVSNTGSVTDGLVLRIKSEGLFIDDDVRGVPQREWDVKAWTLKSVEDGVLGALHVVRATARDAENKKFVFVLEETEAWKVAVGLQRLRKGGTVRGLGTGGMKEGEVKGLLGGLGWV